MIKVAVVYTSSFGNTKTVAETIAASLQDAGLEVYSTRLEDLDRARLNDAGAIIIGSPNHMGNALGGVRDFIKQLGKKEMKISTAVFDTYMGADFQKATGKMEKLLQEKAPAMTIITPGLSIRVQGMRGPIHVDELEKARDFGKIIAGKLRS
ncbi:MAG: flavodoxin domain-containing protein [Dehalococcoidales bacterium]|nr:flavodoxin domain-containing protein [Dehalococcoidales bacterium]